MKSLVLLPLIALAACSPAGQPDNSTATNEIANVTDATLAPPASPAKAYADMTAAADTFEKAAGNLAKTKGSTAAVRNYGKLLYDEHVQFTMELKMATAKMTGVLPNPTMTPEQTADLAKLQAATGAEFDRLFMAQQMASHRAMLPKQRAYAADGDPALTDFAARYARWVERHIRLGSGV